MFISQIEFEHDVSLTLCQKWLSFFFPCCFTLLGDRWLSPSRCAPSVLGGGSASANVALGGVSFTMGCHIEYTTLGQSAKQSIYYICICICIFNNITIYNYVYIYIYIMILHYIYYIYTHTHDTHSTSPTSYASRGLWLALDQIFSGSLVTSGDTMRVSRFGLQPSRMGIQRE